MAERSDQPQLLDPDAIIEEIFARKGPQKYTGGLSEDNWEEELEQIPLFMTRSPETIDPEKAPAVAALQDIKYKEQTPHGRAQSYKEDGNEYFKEYKYKKAVEAYTAGIKEKCGDSTLTAILYTNRAAAQFHLGNYRSSLLDATEARRLKSGHMKALIRGALACVHLERYEEALQWCDEGLRVEPEHAKLREIRMKAAREKKRQERDQRRQSAAEKVKDKEEQKLLTAIKSRGIHLVEWKDTQNHHEDSSNEEGLPHHLSMHGPHPSGEKVHLDADGNLVWPVLFLYPEYGQTDFIAAFSEHHRFIDHIAVMFSEVAPWDQERKYTPSTVEVYYESCSSCEFIPVSLDATLAEVLATQSYTVISGTPSFILLAAGSPFREQFLTRTA